MKNLLICLAIILFSGVPGTISVQNLQVEMLQGPLALDELQPRLSWQIDASVNNINQTAYEIMVAKSAKDLQSEKNLVWNSGKVFSGNNILVPYSGTPLLSRETYWWKVRVWTNQGKSVWSPVSNWTMALIDQKEWKAAWIGFDSLTNPGEQLTDVVNTRLAARYLRKEFDLNSDIKSARLYICGLGMYECYINGSRVGSAVFAPTATDYDRHVNYTTYDVTSLLKGNTNVTGVVLGNGRYFSMRMKKSRVPPIRHFGFPKLLMQLEVEYTSGGRKTVVSDTGWKLTAHGPIISNNEFDGEEYDARLEHPGWNKAGFNDYLWIPARLVEAPKGRLMAQRNPDIRTMEEIKPIDIKIVNGKSIIDLGQNMVGWLSVKLNGKQGQPVVMRFAETLSPDGSLYMANLRGAKVTNIYIPAKDGEFTWCPTFAYQGFRYAEISGIDYKPAPGDFTGKVNYDEMKTIGSFETSNAIINRTYKNACWGMKGNYRSFPTDCPQRDERMPWLGDRATGCFGESFVFDQSLLYEKWLRDIEGCQKENGSLSDVAPNYWQFYSDNITWPAALIKAADMLYIQRGDIRPISEHYQAMKKWLDYMKSNFLKDYIMTKDTYGDWCMPPESQELIHSKDPARKTSGPVLATAYYYHLLGIMEKFAGLLNMPDDQAAYRTLSDSVYQAFNKQFFKKEQNGYDNNTVTANLLSLAFNLVPAEYRKAVFENIANKTMKEFNGHISTGLVGAQWIMRTFTDYGRPDIAYRLATNTGYPSWGYMAEKGATTIWELWNGNTADPAMNSGNHLMLLGDLIIWFYEDLAGIKSDPDAPGFRHIIMKPLPVGDLKSVKASFQSVQGLIRSEWNLGNSRFNWDITVPPNSTATVYVPSKNQAEVSIDGKPAASIKNIRFLRIEDGRALFEIGSGNYRFSSEIE